jgi:hypothetical protein
MTKMRRRRRRRRRKKKRKRKKERKRERKWEEINRRLVWVSVESKMLHKEMEREREREREREGGRGKGGKESAIKSISKKTIRSQKRKVLGLVLMTVTWLAIQTQSIITCSV